MITVKAVALAISLCQPSLVGQQSDRLAKVLVSEASEHGFDPMTAAALICHESRWIATAISPDGEDHGLGQVRARYFGACRTDQDPVRSPSAACVATKASLLDPVHNIRVIADQIERWKKTCRAKTGRRALDRMWLSGYAGLSRPKERRWCGLHLNRGRWTELPVNRLVQDILLYKRQLASGQRPVLPQQRQRRRKSP